MQLKLTLFLLCLTAGMQAQNGLEGLWSGSISERGSAESHPFELYLTLEDGYIKGMSYTYIRPDSIVQQALIGRMYQDRSIYMREVDSPEAALKSLNKQQFDWAGDSPFVRKYQFIFDRSIWESKLEGHWQEASPPPMATGRKAGVIKLKRKTSKV